MTTPAPHAPTPGFTTWLATRNGRIVAALVALVVVVGGYSILGARLGGAGRQLAQRQVEVLSTSMLDLDRRLTIYQTTAQAQTATGESSPGDLARVLALKARDLDSRRPPEKILLAEQKVAANAYLDSLDQGIAVGRWPTDRPPGVYPDLARRVVKDARADYTTALDKNQAGWPALARAYKVSLWERGLTEAAPEAANNPFHDDAGLIERMVVNLLPGAGVPVRLGDGAAPKMGYGPLR